MNAVGNWGHHMHSSKVIGHQEGTAAFASRYKVMSPQEGVIFMLLVGLLARKLYKNKILRSGREIVGVSLIILPDFCW